MLTSPTHPTGDRYEGIFRNGKLEGSKGIYTWVKEGQRKYAGGWADGKPHGEGIYRGEDGRKYAGGFVDGKKHGKGTEECVESGQKYVGAFADDKKHGKGTFTSFGGRQMYVGEWRAGFVRGDFSYAAFSHAVSCRACPPT